MGTLNTPEDLKRKFSTNPDFEKVIANYVANRMIASERSMAANIATWLSNERQYNAEIITKPVDIDRQTQAGDAPIYIPLRIPYTFAAIQTYLTYLLALFTKRRPMFQLMGRTDKDIEIASKMENVLHNNAVNRGYVMEIHTWLRDALIFNRGIMWRDWYTQTSRVLVTKQQKVLGVPIGEAIRTMESTVEDEGNDIFASSPYDTYFDPGVTMQKIQEGEFVARVYYKTWSQVLTKMQAGEYWEHTRARIPLTSAVSWTNRANQKRPGEDTAFTDSTQRPSVEIVDMIIRLVPSEWQLGISNWPEYWRLQIGNGTTVLMAEKLDVYEFPCYVIEPEFDGRSLHTKGLVSMMEPLQELLSWLINSHMDNVRKTINNKVIIDPSKVMWDDVKNNRPYIRLNQRAHGTNPATVMHQLQVYDATSGHLRDIDMVTELLTRISAATENFMGIVNQGGRKTATEVRSANTLAGSRIEKTALVIGHQGFLPLTRGLVNGIQNNLSSEFFYRDFQGDASTLVPINPEDLRKGHFNYPPIDPTIPVDRLQIAQTWQELIGMIGQNESLAGTYDVNKMLGEWADQSGIKNLDNYKVQVAPTIGGPNEPASADGSGIAVEANFTQPSP